MIEIIQEQDWGMTQGKNSLPKNVKQIGISDAGDRIYIENEAYQKLHPYGNRPEKDVYIMLGHFDDFAGCGCVFIETVIEMNEVSFNGNLPIWNDESWAALYRKLRPEHENMIIVGWAVDICGQLPSMTAQLEHIHQSYFGGVHQVLLLMDSLEREETFYSNKNGYLKRREGFFVYYDKINALDFERANLGRENRYVERVAPSSYREPDREEMYRDYLNSRKPSKKQQPSYLPTFLLLAVIVGLGYSAFQNYTKMNEMQLALNQMNNAQAVMQTETTDTSVIRVEEIAGNVGAAATEQQEVMSNISSQATEILQTETILQTQATETLQTESTQQSTETLQTISEAEQYLAQGYYIVQPGDSLASISRKIYHTAAMMDELCELNEIEDADAIYAGQYLKLPK